MKATQVDRSIATVTIIRPYIVHDDAGVIIAVCSHPELANRIAQLFDRHGITDTPDDPSDIET